MNTTECQIDTYEVTITSHLLDGPFVVELIGTTPKAAISRARMAAVHMYRDMRLLYADAEITNIDAGV